MRNVRRILGVAVALLVLAVGALAVRGLDGGGSARGEAERNAVSAGQRAGDALRLHVKSLEIRASAAAGLPQLTQQLTLLRQFPIAEVAKTLEDWFQNEPHWEPFRKEFPIYGLSAAGDELHFVHGAAVADLPTQALVRAARDSGLASDTVMVKGWPHAAAAIRVPVSNPPPGLMVARPFVEATLKEVADRVGGAVVLSDGRKVLGSQGPPEQVSLLTGLVGREQAAAVPGGDDGRWAAGRAAVGPGLWLWIHAGGLAAGQGALGLDPRTTRVLIWSAAAVVAALALVVGLLGGPRAGDGAGGLGVSGMTGSVGASGAGHRAPTPYPPAYGPGGGTDQGLAGLSPLPPTMLSATGAPPPAGAPRPSSAMAATQGMGMAPGEPAAAGAVIGPGKPFGRYLLLDRLGEGGMSQVYTAVTFGAEGFRRKFVVKRLRPELSNDPAAVAQFIDEANMASSLVHSNIVPVFDFGKEGAEYFLATEYILGRDLGRLVRKLTEVGERAMPVGPVLYCAHEVLRALEYAHTKLGESGEPLGIVHRDVSPNNILVSARGEVKLFDFGIVKAEGRMTRTQHGVVKGNVSFMSPEHARGAEIDGRADLFALGLVLYYCLTGELLYQGNTTYELLVKAATGPEAVELARIHALPPPAASILARALQADPARRFQTAGEFAAVIAGELHGGPRELAELMQRLFADEFRAEEKRFAAPAAADAAAGRPWATSK
jgi:hypothetical protein